MQVSLAHKALSNFSENNAGIGLSIDIIRKLMADQILRLNSRFTSMESSQSFKKDIKIFFEGHFDTSSVTPKFETIVNETDTREFFPTVNLDNLKIKISGFLVNEAVGLNKKLTEFEILYSTIAGRVHLQNKKLVITLLNESHEEMSFTKLWETDTALRSFFEDVNTYHFLPKDWDDLTIHFKTASIFSGGNIAESLIDSLELPDIFEVFNGIKFGDNEKMGADSSGELLMFTASSQLDFTNCPTYNASGQTRVISTNPKSITDAQPGETNNSEITIESGIDPTSGTLQYPTLGGGETEQIHNGDIFLFTPIELLRINFDVVKPSVTASDSGRYGPIRWRYSVTAAAKIITLTLINSWPIEFRLSVPCDVTGQAGAGVKIGCVRHEVIGAMFNGSVIPFDINFKICLDWSRRQIVFISKIENIKGVDFQFHTHPRLRFPISEVIDVILGKAADFVITKQAGRMLNITRIPIANLDILKNIAELTRNEMAGISDIDGNVTMGVKFKI